jgi:predicted transcriptional regulator
MANKDEKLTSVEITRPLFNNFKMACLEDDFSFKKLANRSIFLYLTNKEFREKIHKLTNITINE